MQRVYLIPNTYKTTVGSNKYNRYINTATKYVDIEKRFYTCVI